MRKFAISVAAAALSLGATAGASPFSLSVSTSGEKGTSESESGSLIERMIDSTVSAFGVLAPANGKHAAGDKYESAQHKKFAV